MRNYISFSELASFAQGCQWKWKLTYLDGHRKTEYSQDLDFGTSIHAAVEAYYRRKDPISLEHAIILFNKKWAWLTRKNGSKYPKPLTVKDYTSLLAAGGNILRFLKDLPELRDAEPVHNEFKLFEPIDLDVEGHSMHFKGYIDVVIRGKDKKGKTILWVCDFKTCSWGWNREKREDKWKQFQLFLYKHFLCKKFNIDPKQVRTAFVLLKKAPGKGADPVEWFPVSAGPVSVQRSLDALGSNIAEMIAREKDNSFSKDRSKCHEWGRDCPYFKSSLCPIEP